MTFAVKNDGMASMLKEMSAMQNVASQQSKVAQTDSGFADMLTAALNAANQQQLSAEQLQTRHELGDKDADLLSVMLATQKANISFQSLMQVRNKMLNAYREVINMPM